MSYSSYKNSESRSKVDLIKIKTDYCANNFGVSPCTATGVRCYNTFFTCKDKENYSKTTKEYSFINNDLSNEVVTSYFPARPYLNSINDLPTEIKENDTVVKRLKINLMDEPDNDHGIDPYSSTRITRQGTYWKKWLARNKNYKGRIVEVYEGYAGLDIDNFEMKFAGRIESITYDNYSVTIECTDLLSKLSDIEYPLKSNYRLEQALPNVHICRSEEEMLTLNAIENDFAERQDFEGIANFTALDGVSPTAELEEGNYYFRLVAYDNASRAIATAGTTGEVTSQGNLINLSWTSFSGANYYEIYKSTDNEEWIYDGLVTTNTASITNLSGEYKEYAKNAERIYQLGGEDPSSIENWDIYSGTMYVFLDSAVNLDTEGYIKVNKEIIYYSGLSSGTTNTLLVGVKRHQFDTEAGAHERYTYIYSLFMEDFQNPFDLLAEILNRAGISNDYISSKFTTYKNSWTGILFSTKVIVKKTKLNKIYYQLVNALDCMSWVGEDGKIQILKHSERNASYTQITDDANIIANTGKVDLNEGSRYTRYYMYWNRWDVEEDIESGDSYNRLNGVVDADAETENEYNESIDNVTYSTWINLGYNSETEVSAYVDSILTARQNRTSDARIIYECELENKDGDIVTGQLVELTTNDIQDINGDGYEEVLFRVIAKVPKKNKFAIKLLQIEDPEIIEILSEV